MACAAAGFSPRFGPPFTTDQDTLTAIAHDRKPSWTVYDVRTALLMHHPGISFRHLAPPAPAVPTFLGVRRGPRTAGVESLIAACLEVGAGS